MAVIVGGVIGNTFLLVNCAIDHSWFAGMKSKHMRTARKPLGLAIEFDPPDFNISTINKFKLPWTQFIVYPVPIYA